MIKRLKKFKPLISNNKIHLLVAHPSVKDFLLSKYLNVKRAGWIKKIMEFDVDIKITKLFTGRGLCEQLASTSEDAHKLEIKTILFNDNELQNVAPPLATSWVQDMTHFLQTGEFPHGLDRAERRYFRLQSIPYVLIDNMLFRKDLNGFLLRCIDTNQTKKLLHEFHDGTSKGQFSPRTIASKIMRVSYYKPSLLKDSYAFSKKCVKCALFAGKEKLPAMPLQPIQVEQPFMRWGIDFIGLINPPSSASHKWVLTTTNYFTHWTEVVALKEAIESSVLNFYEDIVTKFGVLDSIISNNALPFVGLRVIDWVVKHGIHLNTSSNYYPQGNGLAESTNKNLIKIIKRTMEENQ